MRRLATFSIFYDEGDNEDNMEEISDIEKLNEELSIKDKEIRKNDLLITQKQEEIEAKQELIKYINQLSYFYLNNNKIKNKNNIIIRELKNLSYVLNNHLYKYFTDSSPLYNHKFKPGDVCYFFFGVNIIPEMSLDHMGIIISKNKDYLYVLPLCSKQEKYIHAYHPIENNGTDRTKKCDKSLYLMKQSEFSFLDHDSVLNIADIRCISRKRAFKYVTTLDINSHFFQRIINIAYSNAFPTLSYQYNSKITTMNNKFLDLLDKELIQNHVSVNKNDDFNVDNYIKHVYGKLKNKEDLHFNTSIEGVYNYEFIFTDDFENEVKKQFTLSVIGAKELEKVTK